MAAEYINNKQFEKNISHYQELKRVKMKCLYIIEDINDTVIKKTLRQTLNDKEKENLKKYQTQFVTIDIECKDIEIQLASDFFLLSENLTRYFKFHLIESDDAIQESVMICFEKLDRFNSKKGKAFNYLTTCVVNNLRQMHRTSKNYNELKKKFFNFKQTCELKTIIKNGKEIPLFE
jgi:hypothetical protein